MHDTRDVFAFGPPRLGPARLALAYRVGEPWGAHVVEAVRAVAPQPWAADRQWDAVEARVTILEAQVRVLQAELAVPWWQRWLRWLKSWITLMGRRRS